MAKLWKKTIELDTTMEAYTVGRDHVLDLDLVEADVMGSVAHSRMLAKIGLLTADEAERLKSALVETLHRFRAGDFTIERSDEDVHTAVENALVAELGELGKKLHTGRSRNDQVAVDLRIWGRDRMLAIEAAAVELVESLVSFAERNREVPIPGRTHTQIAMPSSLGLWAGAFAESILDDLSILAAMYEVWNQNPLGSAASYGVALSLDREMTTELLGFARVQNNSLYCANSRGKFEGMVLSVAAAIMNDLAKLASDVIFFSMPETGYMKLPEKYCPGSSIMPQKKNPGPLELARAKASTVAGYLAAVMDVTRSLPSGYNRDLQETKEPFMRGLGITEDTLGVLHLIIDNMDIDKARCLAAFKPEIFAADEAIDLAAKGVPFRDAYREVGLHLDRLESRDPVANIKSKTHTGAPGNLGLDVIAKRVAEFGAAVEQEVARLAGVRTRLLGP